jgi:glyoxylase-like metal-dependent hydrolase (beta-lactamase superfamily II)
MTDPGLPFELGQVQLGNNAFEGQNNCYVLCPDSDRVTLVDTGIAMPETEQELRDGLADYGLEFADIDQILLTHWHMDHVGLAGEIQAESGCVVRAHEADAGLIEQDPHAEAESRETLERLVDEWGMPEASQEELLAFLEMGEGGAGEAPDVTPFTGGETFRAGDGIELEAVHLPGHSVGLTGFAFDGRDGRELFSGDALLPYYTPNVGGADTRVEEPLADYLDTLAGIVDAGYARAWPGHRGTIVDPVGRAADIVVHHRERTGKVVDVLHEGPANPWGVSAALFGDLSTIHILHGPGEAYAHLHHLAEAGVVGRDGRDYVLVDHLADLDTLFPDMADLALRPGAIPGPG